jgi:hypothetical protein
MTASAFFARAALLAATALAAVATFPLAAGALAASTPAAPARASQWWLGAMGVPGAWREAPGEGAGVTVAVLSTGVDGEHPDLAGNVITGPDFSGSGRSQGGPFWGFEGTAVASLIAGHGHGPGGRFGITGIAPRARILSVRVTLEYDDPLTGDAAIMRRLPAAIAAGIRYAVAHGARVIALPLDPGTFGPETTGDPAAAGGSRAEREAVSYALAHDVVLVAPAGDNGAAADTANYPAAYPGVIAVGAVSEAGGLAPFTNTLSYVALTAPGVSIPVAAPGGGYGTLSSTDMSAAMVAGVAALIRSRFPRLNAAQTARALESGTIPLPGQPRPGEGHGEADAADALRAAAAISAALPAAPRSAPGKPPARPARPGAGEAGAPRGAGSVAGTILQGVVIGAGVLAAALGAGLALARRRRGLTARHAASVPAAAAAVAAVTGAGASGTRRRALPAPGSHARRAVRAPARGRREVPGTRAEPDSVLDGTVFHPNGAGRTAGRARSAAYPPRPRVIPMAMSGGGSRRPRRGEGRPPWELFPEAGPVSQPVIAPGRSVTSSGPMYVWNPAASSGPFPAAPDPDGRGRPRDGAPG